MKQFSILPSKRNSSSLFPRSALATLLILAGLGFTLREEGLGQEPQVRAEKWHRILSDSVTLPAFVPDSSADQDLGIQQILTPVDDYDPFTLSLFTGYQYTDNANLSNIDPLDDHVWWASADLTYLPIISGNLYGEISVADTWYLYDKNSELDFHAFEGNVGLVYVIRQLGDVSTFVRYHYDYIDNYNETSIPTADIGDTYQNHAIQLGFYKPWTISSRHFLYLSYISEFSMDAKPSYAVRDEHGFTLGYRIHPFRKVTGDVYYQLAYLDFRDDGRDDWNHSFGAAISYHFTRNIYLAVTASYNDNDSNVLNADYNVWTTGVHLGGIFQF